MMSVEIEVMEDLQPVLMIKRGKLGISLLEIGILYEFNLILFLIVAIASRLTTNPYGGAAFDSSNVSTQEK
jgi:hypothetical protein